MASTIDVIESLLRTAQTITAAIPGASAASPLIGLAGGIAGMIDDLTSEAPDERTREVMRTARAQLAAAVSAKAERTADRFD